MVPPALSHLPAVGSRRLLHYLPLRTQTTSFHTGSQMTSCHVCVPPEESRNAHVTSWGRLSVHRAWSRGECPFIPTMCWRKWNRVPFIPAMCWEKWNPVPFIPAMCWEKWNPDPFIPAMCWEKWNPDPFIPAMCWEKWNPDPFCGKAEPSSIHPAKCHGKCQPLTIARGLSFDTTLEISMAIESWSHDRRTSAAFLRDILQKSCPFTISRRSPNLHKWMYTCTQTLVQWNL